MYDFPIRDQKHSNHELQHRIPFHQDFAGGYIPRLSSFDMHAGVKS